MCYAVWEEGALTLRPPSRYWEMASFCNVLPASITLPPPLWQAAARTENFDSSLSQTERVERPICCHWTCLNFAPAGANHRHMQEIHSPMVHTLLDHFGMQLRWYGAGTGPGNLFWLQCIRIRVRMKLLQAPHVPLSALPQLPLKTSSPAYREICSGHACVAQT